MVNAFGRERAFAKGAVRLLRRLPAALEKRRDPFGDTRRPELRDCDASKVRANEAVGATAVFLQCLDAAIERLAISKVTIEKLRDRYGPWR
ncbi:MAG TPA: hypothetical protein VGI19_01375 [Candidatus Cybelea sp.]